MTIYIHAKKIIKKYNNMLRNVFIVKDTSHKELSIAMTKNMHEKLKNAADFNQRTFNNEILIRLIKTLYDDEQNSSR